MTASTRTATAAAEPMLPGMFSGTCNYWPRSKPPYASEPCNFTTTHRPDFEAHMREHGRKPYTLTPVWARPNHGRWRGPRFASDAKRAEALTDVTERAALIRFRDARVPVEGTLYDMEWTYAEGQYWCDAYGKDCVWVVPSAPLPDGALAVQVEKVRHWTEERGWFDEWRRAGAWFGNERRSAK